MESRLQETEEQLRRAQMQLLDAVSETTLFVSIPLWFF
jgi:hypothetical protein